MKKVFLIAVTVSAITILLVIFNYNLSFQKKSTIVLPAGGTYLGPTSDSRNQSTPIPGIIHGRIYPYSFSVPETVKLVTFPNDPFDINALSINNQPPEQNVLIGVDDLNRTDELKKYIKGNKRKYVENWWKQFGGLKGVASITEFTNSMGLKGYKAKFINNAGQTPNDDIFFEVVDPAYVIHLANGPLDKKVFDAIVDSVVWPARNASRSEAGEENK